MYPVGELVVTHFEGSAPGVVVLNHLVGLQKVGLAKSLLSGVLHRLSVRFLFQ